MRDNQIHRRFLQWVALPAVLLMYCLTVWADANDPILPGPNSRGAAEGLGVGSLIDTVVMGLPEKDGEPGKIVVWGYRYNGHSGNYNWNGNRRGYEHGTYPSNFKLGRQMGSVRDFNDPNHPLSSQKVMRLFTTAHTILALTEEGELWGWGDSLHGTAGCIDTGYETPSFGANTYRVVRNGAIVSKTAAHYQARPCPAFSRNHPNPELRKKVIFVDGGEYNVIAITDDGNVYTWGSAYAYQTVRSGTYTVAGGGKVIVPTGDKGEPLNITGFFVDKDGEPETVHLVGGAYEGQYAVSMDKNGKYSVWGWGRSSYGSLVSSNQDIAQPTRLSQYNAYAKDIDYINGGFGWTGARLTDGRVLVSGRGRYMGQGASLGDNTNNYTPIQLFNGGISKLIVRYLGGVAYAPEENALYHWGGAAGSAYAQIYGRSPVKRKPVNGIKSIGATKEAIFYLDGKNELYGFGYSNQRVMNLCGIYTISYDRNRGRYVHKNNMNWNRYPSGGGEGTGYRIPYEYAIDTEEDLCDGRLSSGPFSGQYKNNVMEWVPYFYGTDAPIPSSGTGNCEAPEENC